METLKELFWHCITWLAIGLLLGIVIGANVSGNMSGLFIIQ